jgi:hypothetical protein
LGADIHAFTAELVTLVAFAPADQVRIVNTGLFA